MGPALHLRTSDETPPVRLAVRSCVIRRFGPGLSFKAAACDRALSTRRAHRRAGPRAGPGPVGRAGPARHSRQQGGRGRQYWHGAGRQGTARRLHAGDRSPGQYRCQPHAVSRPALQGLGSCTGVHAGHGGERAGGQRGGSGALSQATAGTGRAETQRRELRLARRR